MARVAALLALAALLAIVPAAPAHDGNPNYLSQVDRITPAADGVTVDVLNRDDRLLLHNTSGEDVVIEGYDDEPYARLRADGTVEVNLDSEAYYVNDDRFARVDVPAGVDGKGAPRWKEVGRTGRFEWHDHRAHWMAQQRPPQVTDESVRTKVFDWKVPMQVDGQPATIAGTLFWTPVASSGPPLLPIIVAVVVLVPLFIAIIVVRRRRAAGAAADDAPSQEAW